MTDSSTRSISNLTAAQKLELLNKLRQRNAKAGPAVHPTCHMQHDQWLHEALNANSTSNLIPLATRIHSSMDVTVLRRAFQAIIDRHAVLRTTYEMRNSQLVQLVHASAPVSFEHVSTAAMTDAEMSRRIHEDLNRPFDLQSGPVHRVTLYSKSDTEHTLLFVVHHIAADFWSVELLIDELREFYRSILTGTVPKLPPLGSEFTDYVNWEAKFLASPESNRTLEYWKTQLVPAPPALELPADRPRPAIKSSRGGTRLLKLDDDVTDQLRMLSKEEDSTLYATLLTAFVTLLYRYSGQEDFIVGAPTAARSLPQFRNLVGCLVGGLFVRADLSGEPSFREQLRRTRKKLLEALDHQNYPSSILIKKLKISVDPSRSPVAEVLFGWDRVRIHPKPADDSVDAWLDFDSLVEETFALRLRGALFDLMMIGVESGRSLSVIIQYSDDIFDDSTVARIERHFAALLRSIVEDPDRPLRALTMHSAEEERSLLVDWAAPKSIPVKRACFHELFESAAAEFAEREALVFGGETQTYAELNSRANRLARLLSRRGIGPEMRVVVCREPSTELVAAALGIMKAGCVYVPVDPNGPRDRLELLLADADPAAIITRSEFAGALASCSAPLILLDDDSLAGEPSGNLSLPLSPHHAAYMIYTSGSTGIPKGVVVPHGAVANLAAAMRAGLYAEADRPLRGAFLAPAVFDASIEQLLLLALGYTLCIPPSEVRADAEALQQFVLDNRLDVLDVTPTHLRMLLDAGLDLADPASPWLVFAGAEALDQKMFQHLSSIERISAFNVYGPTECTVDATYQRIDGRPPASAIGRAIANTQTYILDQRLNPVPIGVEGELYVGGDQLARGYWKQPRLTAEKFIPDPFSGRPGARLYRTGDRVRWLPDGRIDYRGRLDNQVKVRGFRINCSEIETALAEHPRIRATAVLKQEIHGDPHLVAYVVPNDDAQFDAAEIVKHLQMRLPSYMIPSAFACLDALPMNINGKLDRALLPIPELGTSAVGRTVVPPSTALQAEIAELWSEVLHYERAGIGIHDDFFAMGGNSLLAARLILALRRQHQVELPLHRLFQAPTIEALAESIAQAQRRLEASTEGPLIALQADGTKRPLFLVHGGYGTVLSYGELARQLGPDQPLYAFQSRGLEDGQQPDSDIPAMAARYIACLRRVQPEGPYRLGGWSMGGIVALEMAKQLTESNQEIELLAVFDTAFLGGRKSLSPEELQLITALESIGESSMGSSGAELLSVIETHAAGIQDILRHGGDTRLPALFGDFSSVSEESLTQLLKAAAPSVVQELVRHLRVLAGNIRAMSEYRPEPTASPVVLFLAADEPESEAAAVLAEWQDLARGWFKTCTVSGTHHTMFSEPHVTDISAELGRILAELN